MWRAARRRAQAVSTYSASAARADRDSRAERRRCAAQLCGSSVRKIDRARTRAKAVDGGYTGIEERGSVDGDGANETAWRDRTGNLAELLSRKVVGQADALRRIVPYIQMYQTRLNAPDRPAGVFLLLGPSGTGKTRTVEALAEILHGSAAHLLKIDCAEYQSDHEVAKLIGAPPGYIGHRETKPLLTQERLLAAVSPHCDLALVLFDEIEKAAPAFSALLLASSIGRRCGSATTRRSASRRASCS